MMHQQMRAQTILCRMAVADIFEALTADDRPCKTATSAETALSIMRSMASEGHIDPDILALFGRAGIAGRFQPAHNT